MTAVLEAAVVVAKDHQQGSDGDERRHRLPSTTAVMGTAVLVAGLFAGLRPLGDNSFLTHLATGRLILAHGIPRSDPYSFTAHGAPWTVQSWLASVLYAVTERAGGSHAVVILSGLVAAALAGLLWRLTRSASTLAARQVTIVAILLASAPLWTTRPFLLGCLLLAVTLVVVEEGRHPWVLIPVGWIWVNVHGSFPLAVAYIVLRLGGRWIDGRRDRDLVRALGYSIAGILAGAVGPLGPRLLLFPAGLLSRRQVLSSVREWTTAPFGTPGFLVFLLVAVGVVALARHRPYEDVVPAAAFAVLGIIAIRNIAPAAVVLTPVLARSLPFPARRPAPGRAVNVVLLAVFVVAGAVAVGHALTARAYDLRSYPVDELAWMRAHGVAVTRMAAPTIVGNYLEWRDGTATPVFQDDRFDMYPVGVVTDAIRLNDGAPAWAAILDRYEIDTVLWPAQAPLAQLVAVDPRWRVVHRTPAWVVAVRSTAPAGLTAAAGSGQAAAKASSANGPTTASTGG